MADQESAPQGNGQPPANIEATMQIIWVALLSAIGIYAVLGLIVVKPAPPSDQLNVIAVALMGVAVMQTAFAFLAPRFLPKMPSISMYILRWAMAESVAICGLMLRFLGAPTNWFLIFIVWSALLMLTLRPGQEVQK